MGDKIESKRCKKMRRFIMFLFVVCGYLLSTTFAVDYIETGSAATPDTALATADTAAETLKPVYMTALNLVFGSMGSGHAVRSSKIGIIFLILPVIGFFASYIDKKSNIKNYISILCGIVGCLAISFLIGGYAGGGAIISIIVYLFIIVLSIFAIFMNLQDSVEEPAPKRLTPHDD